MNGSSCGASDNRHLRATNPSVTNMECFKDKTSFVTNMSDEHARNV